MNDQTLTVFSEPINNATILPEDATTVTSIHIGEIILDVIKRWQVRLGKVTSVIMTSDYGFSMQGELGGLTVVDGNFKGRCTFLTFSENAFQLFDLYRFKQWSSTVGLLAC